MEKVVLPSNLQQLRFSGDFNQPMEIMAFPSSLLNLTFGDRFKKACGEDGFAHQLANHYIW
jgi:hypothetical protein